MHRFFVPEENRTENEIVIHGDDVNHIRNVLMIQIELNGLFLIGIIF